MTGQPHSDEELATVAASINALDPKGAITAQVIRRTIDQLYDGQRTGRYCWEQLYKTEKTHCGTLAEINFQREFALADGDTLDFRIADVEVDCKYSQRVGGWMIPPEAVGYICLLLWASDSDDPRWSMGLVRATAERLNTGGNRDQKSTLNKSGRDSICWLFQESQLPLNVLLSLEADVVKRIFAQRSGQKRVNELFRSAQGMIVRRTVIATVAQQEDYMKRVRANGGARTALRDEGIIVLGQYDSHVRIAEALGLPVPEHGDSVSARVSPATQGETGAVEISGSFWRISKSADPVASAPVLPRI